MTADGLSWRSKIESEIMNEKDIDDFINSQLNIICVLTLKISDNNGDIFESEYS